jgi:hypothetical protein
MAFIICTVETPDGYCVGTVKLYLPDRRLPSNLRIPMKPARHSNRKPATDSDLKPAGIPI